MPVLNTNIAYTGTTVTASNSIVVGNSSVNLSITANSTQKSFSNTSSNVSLNSTAIFVGNSTYSAIVNSSGIYTNTIIISGNTVSVWPNLSTIIGYSTIINYSYAAGWTTWTKPTDINLNSNDIIMVHVIGGGGGQSGAGNYGGGGGAGMLYYFSPSQINAVCNVYIGQGGAIGAAGQTTVFWANSTFSVSAYGGGPGSNTTSGGGGGIYSAGTIGTGGGPLGGTSGAVGGLSIFGGAGGVTGNTDGTGSNSVYGGGSGGGLVGSLNKGGSSVYGGPGGAAASPGLGGYKYNSTKAYGAGGGPLTDNVTGAGANGAVIISILKAN